MAFMWQTPELSNTWMLKDHNRAGTKEKSLTEKANHSNVPGKGYSRFAVLRVFTHHSGCCHCLQETKASRLAGYS